MKNPMTYIQNGDYLIPNLKLSEQSEKPLGRYGRMRKAYLKEHRPILYNHLLLSEKLYPHLLEIDGTAQNRLEQIMSDLEKAAPVRIGIDIGVSETRIGLVDIHQKLLACEKIRTGADRPAEEVIRGIGQRTASIRISGLQRLEMTPA